MYSNRMKYSITRVQKFFTVFLALHLTVLLYLVYQQQSHFFAGLVVGLSLVVFLSHVLSSGKWAKMSIWLSTLGLVAVSLCILALLKGYPVYVMYHILLPMALVFFFRKEPVYFFGAASGIFFMIAYFMNDQVQIFPENFTLNSLYLMCLATVGVPGFFVFIMKRLERYVDFQSHEEKAVEQPQSLYLKASEVSYIFYLKAISDNIMSTALEIRGTALRNIENINKEKGRLLNVLEVAKLMQKTFFDTTQSVDITRDIIGKTLDAARTGEVKVSDIMEMVNKMMKFVDITKKSIYELMAATKKVEGVVHVIDKIASQTRLLSLNASIEGARFVEQQAGFVMVSREVKQLAALTHLSVQDITNTMRDINTKTKGVQEIIYKEGREALEGLQVARLGEQSIKYVVRMMESIQSEILEITEEMEVNKDLAVKITDNFMTIKSFIDENFMHMQELSSTSHDMKVQGDHLAKIIHARQISEMLTKQNDKIYSILTRFVMEFEKIIENGLRRGMLTEENLFSRNYEKIPDEGARKYRARYDSFFESSLQALVDEYITLYEGFKYFIVMDDEGYVPLTNSQNRELASDDEDAGVIIRGGVILEDYVSKQSTKSESIYSLQCILASAEPLMDMSVRLHFKDRYWGAVRAGFRYS